MLAAVVIDGKHLFTDADRRILDPSLLDRLRDPAAVRARITEYEDPAHANYQGNWLLRELTQLPLEPAPAAGSH